ncbi:MAG: UDP-N-acetylglucosamine diphosphorylase/glucosamine-1-phosphate N-acetyltransferase [Gammaproteobacteria bacterium]|nr:UDP-N-acetylglucosamine diphosphorylase/glucosamine-1-phosphate N-acetyltransferase [Gammaproteobacteria bacterium]
MKLDVIILAAGQGTRMKSSKPKVLHELAGKPMLTHVIDTAMGLSVNAAGKIHVIYGHGGEQVKKTLGHLKDVEWAEQTEQLGTGHAVQQAMPGLSKDCIALILYGDVPLIQQQTLENLIATVNDTQMGLLTTLLDNPSGYGRIIRDKNNIVQKIVEHKDATKAELLVNEVNTGIMAVKSSHLQAWLNKLNNNNVQGEYYLTDIIEMAVNDDVVVVGTITNDEVEVTGINDKVQLQEMERAYQGRQAERLMREGVSMADASRFDLRGSCEVGQDVSLDINVVMEGKIKLGNRVKIGPNVLLKDIEIHDDVVVLANSVLEQAIIGSGSQIGPFARIRPDTILAENTRIGNFVEIKKTTVGKGSKISHLSYIGDSELGSGVNIGAGTITCNYDGANKFKTIIGDNAFIGSDTQLVAPVKVGKGATIGAGSTITRDTPDEKLTLSRNKQITIDSWKKPVKTKK